MAETEENRKRLGTKFAQISASVDKINAELYDIEEKCKDSSLRNGLSILQLKNTLMMTHNANLLHLISMKVKGQSIEDSPVVERLIQSRVLMERVKPLEGKLKYQMERLIKVSQGGAALGRDQTSEQALEHRPNLSALLNKKSKKVNNHDDFDDDDADDDDESFSNNDESNTTEAVEKSGISKAKEQLSKKKREKNDKYVPPKLVPMPYNPGDEEKAKRRERRDFMKKYNSNVMRELRDEFSEAPQEYSEISGASAAAYRRVEKLMKERQEQEEEYMTRLPPLQKKLTRLRGISDIDNMAGALTSLKDKTRKSKGKIGKSKGKGGRRRFHKR